MNKLSRRIIEPNVVTVMASSRNTKETVRCLTWISITGGALAGIATVGLWSFPFAVIPIVSVLSLVTIAFNYFVALGIMLEDLDDSISKTGLEAPNKITTFSNVLRSFLHLPGRPHKVLLSTKQINITNIDHLSRKVLANFNSLVVPEHVASHVSKVYLTTSKEGLFVTQETTPTALNLWDDGIYKEIAALNLAGLVIDALDDTIEYE